MEIKKLKIFLRINYDTDDDFLQELIEFAKTFIEEQTNVKYDPNDTVYFHSLILLAAHLYDNRSYITDKTVNTLPYSLDCMIKHIGMRGAKNE